MPFDGIVNLTKPGLKWAVRPYYAAFNSRVMSSQTAWAEDDLHLITGEEETPCLAGRFEMAHDFLSASGRSVRPLRSVIETLVTSTIEAWSDVPQSCAVAAKFVSDYDTRLAKLLEWISEKLVSGPCVTP